MSLDRSVFDSDLQEQFAKGLRTGIALTIGCMGLMGMATWAVYLIAWKCYP